ncbi:MAG: FAD-binding oxidoreductase [Anaerolineales bacterium]
MKQRVFWQDTLTFPPPLQKAEWSSHADIAVIGGGYTGLSAARTLARAGLEVALLEAHEIGWGASSRNGGMALTGLKLPIQTVARRYGMETARRLFDFSLQALDYLENLVQEEAIECDLERSGHLIVANKPAHARALQDEVEWLERHFGYPSRFLPPETLSEEIASQAYYGGTVDERSRGLNPAKYVAGLAQAAERSGARLYAHTPVLRVERRRGHFLLHTAQGPLRAEKVFVATSGYTGPSTPQLQRRILPIGSYIIATAPLPSELRASLIPRRRMVFDTRHYLNYFRLSADGRMIFGGRAAFFPESERILEQSAQILQREMLQVFPQLKGVEVEYVWGGTLDFALDLMPHVGETDGLIYALGYAGHGVALGTFIGHTAAQALLSGTLKDHPFAVFPFPALPFPALRLPLLLLAGVWYRLLDWLF